MSGHNRRTCIAIEPNFVPLARHDDSDDDMTIEYLMSNGTIDSRTDLEREADAMFEYDVSGVFASRAFSGIVVDEDLGLTSEEMDRIRDEVDEEMSIGEFAGGNGDASELSDEDLLMEGELSTDHTSDSGDTDDDMTRDQATVRATTPEPENVNDKFNVSMYEDNVEDDVVDDTAPPTSDVTPTGPNCFECPICYETVDRDGGGFAVLKCKHEYCIGCTIKHMRTANQCAMCRTKVCAAPQKPYVSGYDRLTIAYNTMDRSNMSKKLYKKICSVVHSRLLAESGGVETVYVREQMNRFRRSMTRHDLHKANLIASMRIVNSVAEKYEGDSSRFGGMDIEWGRTTYSV